MESHIIKLSLLLIDMQYSESIINNKINYKMHWISIVGILVIGLGTFLIHYGNRLKSTEANSSLMTQINNQQGIISELNQTINGQEDKIDELKIDLHSTKEELSAKTNKVSKQIEKNSKESKSQQEAILNKVANRDHIDKLDSFVLKDLREAKRDFENKILSFSVSVSIMKDPKISNAKFDPKKFNELEKARRNYRDLMDNLMILANRTKDADVKTLALIHKGQTHALSRYITDLRKVIDNDGVINTKKFEDSYKNLISAITKAKTNK